MTRKRTFNCLKIFKCEKSVTDTSLMESRNNRLEALDSFRGLAALAVFFYHYHINSFFVEWQLFEKAYLFVDFFFILSGFVISLNYFERMEGIQDIKIFMRKRFLRLYPLHFFMLIVYLGIESLKYIFVHFKLSSIERIPFAINNGWSFLSNLFLVQSLGIHDALTYNNASWSISTEFYTYLVFAILAVFMVRISKPIKSLFFLLVSIFLYVMLYFLRAPSLDITYDLGFARCIAGFFLGVFLTNYYRKLSATGYKFSPTYLILSFLSIIAILSQTIMVNIDFYMPPLFALLIFITALSEKSFFLDLLVSRPLKWIGERSYSLYMVHTAIFWLNLNVAKIFFKIPIEKINGVSIIMTTQFYGALNIVFVLLFTLWMSSLSYKYIEKRFA